MFNTLSNEKELDNEWLQLILEVQNLGISINEIRDFLNQSSRSY